ncbi:MAG: tyrosine--tRNA ligase, partial [Bacteroidia bacterium]|nr:tyrosine--tRNA ligase [Bacteroidia bacterium]
TKFGKTESGAVWLDPKKTSPYKFYQFWLNAGDDDVKSWIRIFTLKSETEIKDLEITHAEAPHLRTLQKALAADITTRVHGEEELQKAIDASNILFGNATQEAFSKLDEETFLDIFDGVPKFNLSKQELESGIPIIDLLAEKSQVFPSKGEARKMIQGGGVSMNKEKTDDLNLLVNLNHLINNKFLIVQKGKKNYFLFICTQ